MYKRILIATDGSDLAQRAVTHGLTLAKSVGAGVVFLTVTEMWSTLDMAHHAVQGQQHPIEDYEAKASTWADKVLTACRAQADTIGVAAATVHVSDMEPDEAIIKTAQNQGCDLIIMASHGRGPIGRLLLGSVALKVLTYASVPVLIVR
jgi:nucleotide-binding universal stress UspA family protein